MERATSSTYDPLKFSRLDDPTDANFGDVRGKDVLRRLIAQNRDLEDALIRADRKLSTDPHYAAAMHAAAQSMRAGKIQAFVSYRSERDAPAARALRQAFEELSAGRVSVTLADDFAKTISGMDYKEKIERSISSAHWFVLLVSDRMTNTDWCLFETGMFRGTMTSKSINRLICVRHPQAVLPDPIQGLQATAATEDDLGQLLQGLFTGEDPLPGWKALNPHLEPATIKAHARRVADAFVSPRAPILLHPWVKLTVADSCELVTPADLDPARIQTDQRTADLFGRTSAPSTWGDLVATVKKRNNTDRWLRELTAVLAKARRNERSRPVSGTFESDVGGKVMRPVVHAMESSRTETTFELTFVEEICSAPIHRIPSQTLALLTAVRMNNRIRWEIIERFSNAPWTPDDIDACANVFSRIEREVASFGQWDLSLLCNSFDPESRAEVERIVGRWRQLRSAGMSDRAHMTGELDEAFKAYDSQRVETLFRECSKLNRDFLALAQPAMGVLVGQVPN